ncbi:hypothetical protein LOAG_09969, partial [Loa loa]
VAAMSPTHIYLATFVCCTFFLMIHAGTWLSFKLFTDQKAESPSFLIPYLITDKDLTNVMKMCKERTLQGRIMTIYIFENSRKKRLNRSEFVKVNKLNPNSRNTQNVILRSERSFVEICDALSDLIS